MILVEIMKLFFFTVICLSWFYYCYTSIVSTTDDLSSTALTTPTQTPGITINIKVHFTQITHYYNNYRFLC